MNKLYVIILLKCFRGYMYLAQELNKRKLFQRSSQYLLNDNCRDLMPQIFYRASACILSFDRIEQYQKRCAHDYSLFDDQVKPFDNRLLFVSAHSISIFNEITPILSTLRILQNQFILLMSKYYKTSLPSSMHDFIKKIDTYTIPDNIKKLISGYWDKSGKFLKELRDIDQHYYHLIENSFLSVHPNKKIVILFPDNPDSKSPNSFTFDKKINALDFLNSAFIEINNLYEMASKEENFEENSVVFAARLQHLTTQESLDERTLFMFFEENIEIVNESNANLLLSAYLFNQQNDGEVTLKRVGLTDEKNIKLNERLDKKR